MRADRLIAVLLLLQRHEQVTAQQVADELEISVRTARRDLEALAMAGVPLYSTRGHQGGWRLVGGARTNLTGLTATEVRSLFLAAATSPAHADTTTAALRKLLGAVPKSFLPDAEQAQGLVHHDPKDWYGEPRSPEPPALRVVQEALAVQRTIELTYRKGDGDVTERELALLGLVHKAGRWYAVADTDRGRRTFRVDRMYRARITANPAPVPHDFDLADTWTAADRDLPQRQARVTAIASPWVCWTIPNMMGLTIESTVPRRDGRMDLVVLGRSMHSLVGQVAGFGADLEITGPDEAIEKVREIAAQLNSLYG